MINISDYSNSDREAELLGSCMAGDASDVSKCIAEGLIPEAFTVPFHANAWLALVRITKAGGTFSVESVQREMTCAAASGQTVRIEDILKLNRQPTATHRKAITADVLGLWRQRAALKVLDAARDVAAAPWAGRWHEHWEKVAPLLRQAQIAAVEASTDTFIEHLAAAVAREENGPPAGVIGTGIAEIDNAFGLIEPGELVVLGARPGMGKTGLATQIANHAASSGKRTLFVSLEMTPVELLRRIAQQRAGRAGIIERGIPKSEIDRAKNIRSEKLRGLSALNKKLNIFEASTAGSVEQIDAQARIAQMSSAGLCLVVIDYLQLVLPENRRDPREQQVAQISRRLKMLALELQVPVLLLAQLNRESEKETRPPQLSDLRESGSIEQDADRVWFLYPNPNTPKPDENAGEIEVLLKQAKCRNGAAGINVALRFIRGATLFVR